MEEFWDVRKLTKYLAKQNPNILENNFKSSLLKIANGGFNPLLSTLEKAQGISKYKLIEKIGVSSKEFKKWSDQTKESASGINSLLDFCSQVIVLGNLTCCIPVSMK